MKKENEHCPLDSGEVGVDGRGIKVFGVRHKPNPDVLCAIRMLQRQKGIKAGRAQCRSCGVMVQISAFDDKSSKSLTDSN